MRRIEGGERPLLREIFDHVVRKLTRALEANHVKPPQLCGNDEIRMDNLFQGARSLWISELMDFHSKMLK